MMLGRKIVNAADLCWDSLDSGERMMLAYAAAWVMLVAALALQRRSRDRLRQSILDELAGVRV